jgi:hypothetical protein
MQTLEKKIDQIANKFLIKPEDIWQPTDFLPNPQGESFIEEVKEIRELSKDLDDDFWICMIGDTITEEALPTYESWLLDVVGIIDKITNLTEKAEKARDYLMKLPQRLYRITERISIPDTKHEFKWLINPM